MKHLLKHTKKGIRIGNHYFTEKGASEILVETHLELKNI